MPIVNFVSEKKQVQVEHGANLRKVALNSGIKLYNGINGFGAKLNGVLNCHGLGHCGTCRVLITKGMENTSNMGLLEKVQFHANPPALIAFIGHEKSMRLACRTTVEGDIDVVTCPPYDLFGENFFS